MIGVAVYMLKRKCVDAATVNPQTGTGEIASGVATAVVVGRTTIKESIKKIVGIGFLVGLASGYFGIGGGFLIVPGLIYSAGLNIIQAVGTSLVSVGTFGLVTAVRYSINGDLNLTISALFVLGGIAGGWGGTHLASKVPKRKLTKLFALIIIAVAVYMLFMNISAFT